MIIFVTEEQAIKFCESEWWKDRTPEKIAVLQIYEPPAMFTEFCSIQKSLNYPAFSDNFLEFGQLRKEFE